jgi:hypothetical protein
MKINEVLPSHVDIYKVLEWETSSETTEGIISIETVRQECEKRCNWLLFYAWCYSRTQGFTNKCMKNWDFGCFGGQFKTCREGVKDALSEFIKYEGTEQLAEQVEVEKLYAEIEAFCRGVIWTDPDPLPPQQPAPAPLPEPEQPQEPTQENGASSEKKEPQTPTNWKKIAKIVLPILGLLATFGGVFLPGWAKIAIDSVMKIIEGIIQ